MFLFDVNIYLHAHRKDSPHHGTCSSFLTEHLEEDRLSGYSPLALSGFIRVATHPKVFSPPSSIDKALAIEHGCTWVTTDRDYSRFEGLKTEYPV
jgi:uncharacterized protein